MTNDQDAKLSLPLHRGTLARVGDYIVPIFGVVFLIVLAFIFMPRSESSEWRICYIRAAQRLTQGERIHVLEGESYAYPPAMAMFTIPLANLSPQEAMFGWYLANALACVTIFYCSWKLTGGQRFIGLDRRWLAILGLGFLLSFRYLMINLGHQQFDTVIAAWVIGGCYLLWRGRDLTGAACLGVSAAMKCTPLLFAPYLVWRGKWRAALLMLAVTCGLNVLPDLLWPQTSGRSYLTDWNETFLVPTAESAPGVWVSSLFHNQSLGGLLNRYYSFGLPMEFSETMEQALTAAETRGLKLAFYATALAILTITILRCGAPGRMAPTVSSDVGEVPLERLRLGIESSAVIAMMLLFSPMTSMSHYGLLVLPSLLVARLVVDGESPRLRWVFVGLLILGPLASKDVVGRSLGNLAKVWGLPTWFVLLSLLAMWMAIGAVRRREQVLSDDAGEGLHLGGNLRLDAAQENAGRCSRRTQVVNR